MSTYGLTLEIFTIMKKRNKVEHLNHPCIVPFHIVLCYSIFGEYLTYVYDYLYDHSKHNCLINISVRPMHGVDGTRLI